METQKLAQLLKSKREAAKLSVPAVVERTKIKRSYIEAMESGDAAAFGSMVYFRNFARTYAKFLRIPEPDILALLGETGSAAEEKPAPAEATPETATAPANAPLSPAGRRNMSNALILAALLVAAVGIVWLMKSGLKNSEQQPIRVVAPADNLSVETDTSAPSPPTAFLADTGATAAPATPGVHTAELQAVSEVWLSWETERARSQKLLRVRERQTASFEKNLRLIVGNPLGLKLTVDGAEVGLDTGRVYDRIFRFEEDGRLVIEPTTAATLRRFQSSGQPVRTP